MHDFGAVGPDERSIASFVRRKLNPTWPTAFLEALEDPRPRPPASGETRGADARLDS
jgi:hypothetical protein